jgi:hypothetical protein
MATLPELSGNTAAITHIWVMVVSHSTNVN